MSALSTRSNNFKDITGNTYGNWTVLSYAGQKNWLCLCTLCNTEHIVVGNRLRGGKSTKCAKCNSSISGKLTGGSAASVAASIAAITTHGHSNSPTSPTYITWRSLNKRCSNPKSTSYYNYGGRGITVCLRWRSGTPNAFQHFLDDMGLRPDGCTIDRIDNDGNYELTNCRWADAKQQRANQRVRR